MNSKIFFAIREEDGVSASICRYARAILTSVQSGRYPRYKVIEVSQLTPLSTGNS